MRGNNATTLPVKSVAKGKWLRFSSKHGPSYSRHLVRDELLETYRSVFEACHARNKRKPVDKDQILGSREVTSYKLKRYKPDRRLSNEPYIPQLFERYKQQGYSHVANFPGSLKQLLYYSRVNGLVLLDPRMSKYLIDMSADQNVSMDETECSQTIEEQQLETETAEIPQKDDACRADDLKKLKLHRKKQVSSPKTFTFQDQFAQSTGCMKEGARPDDPQQETDKDNAS